MNNVDQHMKDIPDFQELQNLLDTRYDLPSQNTDALNYYDLDEISN